MCVCVCVCVCVTHTHTLYMREGDILHPQQLVDKDL